MIEKILNLDGVKTLNKAAQNEISGGRQVACYEVTCKFEDGLNWQGSTNSSSAVSSMEAHCESGGGTPQTVDRCLAVIQ